MHFEKINRLLNKKAAAISIFLTLACVNHGFSDIIDLTTKLQDAFGSSINANEGSTAFRSLAIPAGGRSESLGTAYSAVCDDINFFDYNPAASSILKNTEVAAWHNSWISDSNMETAAYTTRFNNLGLGGQLKCFYVPFSEYNGFGDKVNTSYYSETTLTANISYNFFPGYKFRGLALGANIKTSYRSMPDYTDNNTNEIISGSGLEQSALAILADIGTLIRFNFLKFYTDRETNCAFALTFTNFGGAVTFGRGLDDAPPTKAAIGFSYKPFSPILISIEARKNLNLQDLNRSEGFEFAAGIGIRFVKYFELLGGFQLKGSNPRISLGGQLDIKKFTLNVNYTLDLTSSTHPTNHISLSGKIHFGDKGRSLKQDKVDAFYTAGMSRYADGDMNGAISEWKECLKIDPRFDPAKDAIKAVENFQEFYRNLKEIQNLD